MALTDEGTYWTDTIRSEDEAWDYFQRALAGEFDGKPLVPKFDGWPEQEITFWLGEKHEVITAPMAKALLDYQNAIYRAVMFLQSDTTSLRGLSEELRIQFEMDFEVGEGCTKLLPDLEGILTRIAEAAVGNMTGTELTITVLGTALILGGGFAWRAYLKERGERVAEETRSATTRRLVEAQEFASEQETRRLEIITQAIIQATGSNAIPDVVDEAKASVVKAASRMDETEVAGVAIQPDLARRLSRNPRGEPDEVELQGFFEVLRIDSEPETPFRVKVRHRETGEEFFAGIRDALLAGNDRDVIADAEWRQRPFWGRVEARRSRGEITSAVIVAVRRRAA
jgi:hypothetical protein